MIICFLLLVAVHACHVQKPTKSTNRFIWDPASGTVEYAHDINVQGAAVIQIGDVDSFWDFLDDCHSWPIAQHSVGTFSSVTIEPVVFQAFFDVDLHENNVSMSRKPCHQVAVYPLPFEHVIVGCFNGSLHTSQLSDQDVVLGEVDVILYLEQELETSDMAISIITSGNYSNVFEPVRLHTNLPISVDFHYAQDITMELELTDTSKVDHQANLLTAAIILGIIGIFCWCVGYKGSDEDERKYCVLAGLVCWLITFILIAIFVIIDQ
jgi:hypothetical protein